MYLSDKNLYNFALFFFVLLAKFFAMINYYVASSFLYSCVAYELLSSLSDLSSDRSVTGYLSGYEGDEKYSLFKVLTWKI